MAVHVALEHRTVYRFDRPTALGPHLIRLRPAPHCRTPIEAYALTVEGGTHFVNWQQDPFGNFMARVVTPDPVEHLEIRVDLVADLTVINPFDFFVDESAETFPFDYDAALAADLEPYRRHGALDPLLAEWLAKNRPADETPVVQALAELPAAAPQSVRYTLRLEPGVQEPAETLALQSGSCRDSAWLLVTALRELGLAARFVSGYLVQLTPDDATDGPAQDFTDLHAWAEAYIPGAGWIGLDATSGLFAGEGHIPLSATPNPADAAPITGTTGPATTTLEFDNTVTRVREDPRVTRPYDEDARAAILALGEAVDARLVEDDVRLTMGGEPTFVSRSDTDSPQWTVAADGPDKRARAAGLTRLLAAHYAPGGVVQHSQGKWYPGEPLPRWQKAIVWRTDGVPLWPDQDLLADPDAPAVPVPDAHRRAHALLVDVARRLGIDDAHVLPAFEDRLHRIATEARLPAGEPPTQDPDAPLDADLRTALVRVLDADAGEPTGWVLPLHAAPDGDGLGTTAWRFRRGRLVLSAGTSPIGLRLPLDAIAWTPPPPTPDRASMEPVGPLVATAGAARVTPPDDAPTTALCVEA